MLKFSANTEYYKTENLQALYTDYLSGNCSTCFGWYHHPSSGAQTTVSAAFGICHTVTATCRQRQVAVTV